MTRKIKVGNYGEIAISPVNVIDEEVLSCDSNGNEVKTKMEGRGKMRYLSGDTEISRSMVCKKFTIDGEDLIVPRMSMTKEVADEDILVDDDNTAIYSAIERKVYLVMTDSKKIKELITGLKKTLKFPFIAGQGWKVYNALLTYWGERIVLVCVRGDINKVIENYTDEEVELELVPNNINAKKLLKLVC